MVGYKTGVARTSLLMLGVALGGCGVDSGDTAAEDGTTASCCGAPEPLEPTTKCCDAAGQGASAAGGGCCGEDQKATCCAAEKKSSCCGPAEGKDSSSVATVAKQIAEAVGNVDWNEWVGSFHVYAIKPGP